MQQKNVLKMNWKNLANRGEGGESVRYADIE